MLGLKKKKEESDDVSPASDGCASKRRQHAKKPADHAVAVSLEAPQEPGYAFTKARLGFDDARRLLPLTGNLSREHSLPDARVLSLLWGAVPCEDADENSTGIDHRFP
jgi:hypothetical protein